MDWLLSSRLLSTRLAILLLLQFAVWLIVVNIRPKTHFTSYDTRHRALELERFFWGLRSLSEAKNKWREFVAKGIRSYDQFQFEGRGVILNAYPSTLKILQQSISTLRNFAQSSLPIEVCYCDQEISLEKVQETLNGTTSLFFTEICSTSKVLYKPIAFKKGVANYEMKMGCILESRFKEVLYLDSDNFALKDPTFLFDSLQFQTTGAIMWPDYWKHLPNNPLFSIFDISHREEEFEVEAGQLLVDKEKAWKALHLAYFIGRNDDYAPYFFGDKDMFATAFKALDMSYFMMPHYPSSIGRQKENNFCGKAMGQHSFDGILLFVHFNGVKYAKFDCLMNAVKRYQTNSPTNLYLASFSMMSRCVDLSAELVEPDVIPNKYESLLTNICQIVN